MDTRYEGLVKKMIPEVASIVLYLLLLVAGLLIGIAQKRGSTKDRNAREEPRLSLVLVGAAVIIALLMALGWLPTPSYGWLLPAVPLFAIWCTLGVLGGIAIVGMRAKLRWVALLSVAGTIGLGVSLLVFGWPLDLNPNLGWGLFAVPPVAAGALLVYAAVTGRRTYALYMVGWIVVVSTVALPHYLMAMDGQELARAYVTSGAAKGDPLEYVLGEVQTTIVYLVGTLVLLVLPLALSYFRPHRRLNQNPERREPAAI